MYSRAVAQLDLDLVFVWNIHHKTFTHADNGQCVSSNRWPPCYHTLVRSMCSGCAHCTLKTSSNRAAYLATSEASPGSSLRRLSRMPIQRTPDPEHARPLTSLAFFFRHLINNRAVLHRSSIASECPKQSSQHPPPLTTSHTPFTNHYLNFYTYSYYHHFSFRSYTLTRKRFPRNTKFKKQTKRTSCHIFSYNRVPKILSSN